jgi:hypothetical protein
MRFFILMKKHLFLKKKTRIELVDGDFIFNLWLKIY